MNQKMSIESKSKIRRDCLVIDWTNVINKFKEKTNAIRGNNQMLVLRLDYIRSPGRLFPHVQPLKISGPMVDMPSSIDIALLDALICLKHSIMPYSRRTLSRKYNQQVVLLECIVEAIDMELVNDGWNAVIKTDASIGYIKELLDSKNQLNDGNSTTSSSCTIKVNEPRHQCTLVLQNFNDKWSSLSLFQSQFNGSDHKQRRFREILELMLGSNIKSDDDLVSLVVDGISKLISDTDFIEYYKNKKYHSMNSISDKNGVVSVIGDYFDYYVDIYYMILLLAVTSTAPLSNHPIAHVIIMVMIILVMNGQE